VSCRSGVKAPLLCNSVLHDGIKRSNATPLFANSLASFTKQANAEYIAYSRNRFHTDDRVCLVSAAKLGHKSALRLTLVFRLCKIF
jgi:hypothetical protein